MKDMRENKRIIESQNAIIHNQEIEIGRLNDKILQLGDLESRVEEQEQYSRRTSLRFNNVQVPLDHGKVILPINTDDLVLKVCRENLKLEGIGIEDIGRSHEIGVMVGGKISIIVR